MYPLRRALRGTQNVRLPDSHNGPTRAFQATSDCSVALPICINLGDPIRRVMSLCQLPSQARPISPVPKIPVAENRDPQTREHYVWRARNTRKVPSIPKTEFRELPTQQLLMTRSGFSVGPFRLCGSRRRRHQTLERDAAHLKYRLHRPSQPRPCSVHLDCVLIRPRASFSLQPQLRILEFCIPAIEQTRCH
jgi:hypothetical protein